MSVAPLQFLLLVFAGWVNRHQAEVADAITALAPAPRHRVELHRQGPALGQHRPSSSDIQKVPAVAIAAATSGPDVVAIAAAVIGHSSASTSSAANAAVRG